MFVVTRKSLLGWKTNPPPYESICRQVYHSGSVLFISHIGDVDGPFWEFVQTTCTKSTAVYIWIDFLCLPRSPSIRTIYQKNIPFIIQRSSEFVAYSTHTADDYLQDVHCMMEAVASKKRILGIHTPTGIKKHRLV